MNEEIKEVRSPLDLVTIPVKEYKELCKAEAILGMTKQLMEKDEEIHKIKEDAEQYRGWWCKYSSENDKLKEELEEAHKTIDKYKADMQKLLGIQELQKVKEESHEDS